MTPTIVPKQQHQGIPTSFAEMFTSSRAPIAETRQSPSPSSTTLRPSRSIVDIIAAVERSKSQWQAMPVTSSFAPLSVPSRSSGVIVAQHAHFAPHPSHKSNLTAASSTPASVSHFSSAAWPPLPSQVVPVKTVVPAKVAKVEADSVAEEGDATLQVLPAPLRASASRQEHHRYFYALRKASRLRKQQGASSASSSSAVVTASFSSSAPLTNAAYHDAHSPSLAVASSEELAHPSVASIAIPRPRSHSYSSLVSDTTTSVSPTAFRACSALSTSSATATSTAEDSAAAASGTTAVPDVGVYSRMLSAWQQASKPTLSSSSCRSDPFGFEAKTLTELLCEDDAREEVRLFDEISANLLLQHQELVGS